MEHLRAPFETTLTPGVLYAVRKSKDGFSVYCGERQLSLHATLEHARVVATFLSGKKGLQQGDAE